MVKQIQLMQAPRLDMKEVTLNSIRCAEVHVAPYQAVPELVSQVGSGHSILIKTNQIQTTILTSTTSQSITIPFMTLTFQPDVKVKLVMFTTQKTLMVLDLQIPTQTTN